MEKTSRNLSLDLLRIICMLMVVCLHSLGHGGLIEKNLIPGAANFYLCNILFALCIVAVNCFVMISGYFLCTTKFSLKKLARTWGLAIFYSVVVYFILVFTGLEIFSIKEVIKHAMVLTLDRYWFVTEYLLLFMAFPLLNYMIKAMSKKMHLLCCGFLLLVSSFLHNLVYISDFANIKNGYSFIWFCVLYIVAAYLRLYSPEKIKHQRLTLPIYLIACLIICGERFLAYWITPRIFGRVVLTSLFYPYNSIFTFAAALFLFQFFRGITISRLWGRTIVSKLSPLVFAVYLIHEQDFLRPHLWSWLNPGEYAESPFVIPYVLVCTIAIFSVCCGIEWLRQKLFRILRVHNILDKVCDRIQSKLQLWLDS